MQGTNSICCLYCLAPHPKITHSTKKTAGVSEIVVGTVEEISEITPIIECPFCKKKYLLISKKCDVGFNNHLIRTLKHTENCFALLERYKISTADVCEGIRGVSKIQWVADSVTNIFKPINAQEDHFHLVFDKERDVFFIDITKNSQGESIGTNIEKVLI